MNYSTVKYLVLVFVGAGLLTVGIVIGKSTESCEVSVQTDGQDELLALINDYRLQNNLEPLSFEIRLEAAAGWFAADMYEKSYLSHTDSLGRDMATRLSAFGYPENTWRVENLAVNYDPAATFAAWVASPGHNTNLLNASVQNIGLGIAGNVWVMDAGQAGDLQPPPPLPTLGPVTPAPVVLTPAPTYDPCQ